MAACNEPPLCAAILLVAVLVLLRDGVAAQRPLLDPGEFKALQVFADSLGIGSVWNFSVDPCSGLDGWNNTATANDFNVPTCGIECGCDTNSCRVTRIAVVSMNARGVISPEIGNFSLLNDLNLGQNVLTGTIPEEIGKLTNLQYFNVAINKLSGPLPSSIGKLTKLVSMGFGSNLLTGTLPKEIGNLQSLVKIYMDVCNLGGELPQEFGNLTKLETIWMAGNNYNGSIPDFFGNLVNLQDLKIHGNNFKGPIPPSLGNLQNLKTLDIGDVSSGGIIPTSLNLLKGLSKLILRNCELSGPIPELGNLTSLTLLDLSFNNLSGPIPKTFGSLSSLQNLLLGSNKLTGEIPNELGSLTGLQRLDVSFNELTGPLPSWLRNSKLQTNYVWNNFSTDPGQKASSCLQGRTKCNEVEGGKNFEFAINCGGPRLATSTGVTFSEDSTSIMVGTNYGNQGWAVTSTGYSDGFVRAIENTSVPVLGTVDPKLYQTARSAPSSLRYLGLGMVNGLYTLELHFAETVLDNSSTWVGNSKRIFDVYIQGVLNLKEFNIQNKAKGSLRALIESFKNVSVTNNVLDIHFLWKGKGTCCYGPLIAGIRVIPGFDTSAFATKTKSNKSKALGAGLGVGISALLVVLFAVWLLKRRRRPKYYDEDEEDLRSLEGKPNLFSFTEMKAATRNFSAENKLGQGGFGAVYKGVLFDGTVVAIKQLSSKSQQGTREFLNEVEIISAVQHRNLVKLHGCCIEGDHRILIYEYLENNSLYHVLLSGRGPKVPLDWPTRFKICVGVARGIAYLHEDSRPKIVHRDIKASNVLLDKDMNPKIADFGLAKLFLDQESHVSTRVAGTIGYLAPEYAMRGQLTDKADIYSFGVLALEIVSGRTNLDTSLPSDMVYLLEWAWHLYETGEILKILDPQAGNYSEEQVVRVVQVALLCSQAVASARPVMSHVVAMLMGTAPVDISSLRPGYFSALKDAAPGFFSDGQIGKRKQESSTTSAASCPTTSTTTGTNTTGSTLSVASLSSEGR